jgi:hypothetical protein
MTIRFVALAFCRAAYETVDGDLSKPLELDKLATCLDISRKRAEAVAEFAQRKGWVKCDAQRILLLEEGWRQAQSPAKLGFHRPLAANAVRPPCREALPARAGGFEATVGHS